MNRKINRVKLYVKDSDKARIIQNKVEEELLKYNFLIVDDDYELAISIGGDGTFLKMIHANNFNSDIYYASINAGSLGFLSIADGNNFSKFIRDLNENNYLIKNKSVLDINLSYDNKKEKYFALNELTIRKNDFSTIKLDILVNRELLEKFNGDGIVISTTVGSTAYNQSLIGPIIDNEIDGLLLSPIAPLNNKVYKSLINSLLLSQNNKLTFIPHNNNNLCIIIDGVMKNVPFDKIECTLAKKINLILTSEYNYINKIGKMIIDSKE